MTNNVLNVDFTSKNTFEEKANYSEIVFGLKRPLLTPELNELQSILKSHRTNIIDSIFGSGILGVGTIKFSGGTLTVQNEKAIIKGELINITSQNIALSEGNDVYLTASYVEKTGSDTIKEYGNSQSSTNVTNRIEDENYGETSRRKQLIFSLSKVSVPNALNLKLGRISGGKFIQECDTIANNLASNIVASKLSIKDAENLFDATNVEDALIELMRQIKTVYKNVEGSFISEENTLDSFAKNIEIKGNTVQNPNNLADIKSVGDKVEGQELYRIPIACCSKNLCNSKLKFGSLNGLTGVDEASTTRIVTDFIKVNSGFDYSWVISNNPTGFLFCYDSDKKLLDTVNVKTYFTKHMNGVSYVKFRLDTTNLNTKITLVQGKSQISNHIPYQEHAITILSPVQLEKVGDVEDRIIEKDGVWGVEKNVIAKEITSDMINTQLQGYTHVTPLRIFKDLNDINYNIQSTRQKVNFEGFKLNSNDANYNNTWDVIENEGKYSGGSAIDAYVLFFNKSISVEQAKQNMIAKHMYFLAKKPQFIPLPDDQQVKLRTFANQTNISFLTEVEGTIKADIPSNLGATINSNTLAIQELSKDLEGVKKLEEATTSTVVTESNSITIGETINGYLSDVKLEGRTLNNIFKISRSDKTDTKLFYECDKSIGTTFKGIDVTLFNPASKKVIFDVRSSNTGIWKRSIIMNANEVSKYVTLTDDEYIGYIYGQVVDGWVSSNEELLELKSCCVVLNGDKTSLNFPYFEGMKSVGDGVDEIVVASTLPGYRKNIAISTLKPYPIDSDGVGYVLENIDRGELVVSNYGNSSRYMVATFDSLEGSAPSIERFDLTGKNGEQVVNITQSANYAVLYLAPRFDTTTKGYIYQKHDKKKALYYDTETQTWNKPILRKWDSIEKHPNGKYYYHKRSGIKIFNGNSDENWTISSSGTNQKLFMLQLNDLLVNKNNSGEVIVCDKLASVSSDYHWTHDGNLITVGFDTNHVRIKLEGKDSLDTLKQWLQNNPTTIVYKLAEEKVYECTPIDLVSYEGETNYLVNSGSIIPKTTLKVQNYLANVLNVVKDKVDNLEDVSAQTLLELIGHNHDDIYFKQNLGSVTDFNTATKQGKYYVSSASVLPNSPINSGVYGELLVLTKNSNELHQIYFDYSGEMYLRFKSNNNGWHEWVTVYTSAKKPKWNDILEKPSTFTPSTHDHDGRYYTESEADNRFLGKTAKASSASVADKVEWSNVANKPSTFTPSTHNHDDRYFMCTPKRLTGANDLNTVTTGGNYIVAESKNAPYNYGRLVVLAWDSAKWCTQIFYSDIRNEVFTRCSTNAEATSWTPWQKLVNTNDANNMYVTKDDILNAKFSDPLITDDSKIVTVGKGSVNTGGSYVTKDFRNQMKRSIVTLTDVVGHTEVRNRRLWDVNLSSMATYKPSDVVEIFKQPVLNNNQSYYDVTNGNTQLNIRSSSIEYGYVQFKLVVKPYTDYMVSFDVEEVSGNSWVAVATSEDGVGSNVICDITYQDGSTSAIFNTGDKTIIYIRFFANVHLKEANKEVSYKNAKLIKVRDYYSGDLVLRSLPNGVSDELKDGKPIIRIGKYTLNGYENWSILDSSKPNTNAFLCNLPDAIIKPDKTSVCLQNNKYESVSDSELYDSDKVCMAMGGNLGQLVFRVGKGLNTVEALRTHLRTNETDITVYYEITPRTQVMDSQNKLNNVSIGLIAETGDELHLGTPVTPITSSHKVQLTTQAQIQELQNDVSETKKSMWGKLKGLLDCDVFIGMNHNYIKLPSLFGGFIFQWGYEELGSVVGDSNYITKEFAYPITFPNEIIYASMGYMRSSNSWQDLSGNAVGVGDSGRERVRLHIRNTTGNPLQGNVSASWFAVGR